MTPPIDDDVADLFNDETEETVMSLQPHELQQFYESDTEQSDNGDPNLDTEQSDNGDPNLDTEQSDDQQAGPSNRYPILDGHITISAEFDQYVRRFNTTGRAYSIHFQNIETVADMHQFLLELFRYLLTELMGEYEPNDRFGLQVTHPGLDTRILIPFRLHDMHNPETVLQHIEDIQQSSSAFCFNDRMVIQITRVNIPAGMGRSYGLKTTAEFLEWIGGKHSLITIPGKDKMCLPRALVTGKALLHKDDSADGQIECLCLLRLV